MKTRKPKLSKRQRRLTELEVQEYVDRYYPAMGKVSVTVSPCGAIASVRGQPSKPKSRT